MQENIGRIDKVDEVFYYGSAELSADNIQYVLADLLISARSIESKTSWLEIIISTAKTKNLPETSALTMAKIYFSENAKEDYDALSKEKAQAVNLLLENFMMAVFRVKSNKEYIETVNKIYAITSSSELLAKACARAFYRDRENRGPEEAIGFELLQQHQPSHHLLHDMAALGIVADGKKQIFETLLGNSKELATVFPQVFADNTPTQAISQILNMRNRGRSTVLDCATTEVEKSNSLERFLEEQGGLRLTTKVVQRHRKPEQSKKEIHSAMFPPPTADLKETPVSPKSCCNLI